VDNFDGLQRLIADDFPCDRKGPITKIYLWGSWLGDGREGPAPGDVKKLHLSIYSDDPVGDDPENKFDDPLNEYSMPLELLWSGSFEDFAVSQYALVSNEYFWDPFKDTQLGYDQRIWQYEVDIPKETAFVQQGSRTNPVVYWLSVSAEINGPQVPQFGWKTTSLKDGWNDTAVKWGHKWVKSDEFDYWEDQTSHSYKAFGSVFQGVFSCDTASLRIGGCDINSYAQFTAAVKPGSDNIMLRYRVPWAGMDVTGGVPGTSLYVDGSYKGRISGSDCTWHELELTGMAADTADGMIDILLVDEFDACAGDIQITYMEVYSPEPAWIPLFYPDGHELRDQKVDMSFAVVTTVNGPGTFFPGFGWNIITANLENTNIPDITGGYVIGSFDVVDLAGPTQLVGEYRFVHQYPPTQDPEQHMFVFRTPQDQSNCEYVATNFRFGHT
jgi:hypothetical protein